MKRRADVWLTRHAMGVAMACAWAAVGFGTVAIILTLIGG